MCAVLWLFRSNLTTRNHQIYHLRCSKSIGKSIGGARETELDQRSDAKIGILGTKCDAKEEVKNIECHFRSCAASRVPLSLLDLAYLDKRGVLRRICSS